MYSHILSFRLKTIFKFSKIKIIVISRIHLDLWKKLPGICNFSNFSSMPETYVISFIFDWRSMRAYINFSKLLKIFWVPRKNFSKNVTIYNEYHPVKFIVHQTKITYQTHVPPFFLKGVLQVNINQWCPRNSKDLHRNS